MLSTTKIEIINALTISELDVLRFIDSNKRTFLDSSIKELAALTFVSTATIMRLCKKLGFSGYLEFKYVIKDELSKEEVRMKPKSFQELLDLNIKAISETAKLLSEEKVMAVVEQIRHKKRIHFFGKGLTSTILQYASKELMTSNHTNMNYQDTHIAYIASESMNEDDLLFVASMSGNTHQVVRASQIAKSRHATVVTISSNSHNELSKIGDYNFTFYRDDKVRQFDIASRLPILFILNIIFTTLVDSGKQINI